MKLFESVQESLFFNLFINKRTGQGQLEKKKKKKRKKEKKRAQTKSALYFDQ